LQYLAPNVPTSSPDRPRTPKTKRADRWFGRQHTGADGGIAAWNAPTQPAHRPCSCRRGWSWLSRPRTAAGSGAGSERLERLGGRASSGAMQPAVPDTSSLVWAPTPDAAVLDAPDARRIPRPARVGIAYVAPDAPMAPYAPVAPSRRRLGRRDLRLPSLSRVGVVAVMAGALVFAGVWPGGRLRVTVRLPQLRLWPAAGSPAAVRHRAAQRPASLRTPGASLQELMVAVIKRVGPSVSRSRPTPVWLGIVYDTNATSSQTRMCGNGNEPSRSRWRTGTPTPVRWSGSTRPTI